MLQAAVDPEFGEFFLDAVLREAAAQGAEIDAVHFLVLVEAGKDDRLGAGDWVAVIESFAVFEVTVELLNFAVALAWLAREPLSRSAWVIA